jgi:hypothetical protein
MTSDGLRLGGPRILFGARHPNRRRLRLCNQLSLASGFARLVARGCMPSGDGCWYWEVIASTPFCVLSILVPSSLWRIDQGALGRAAVGAEKRYQARVGPDGSDVRHHFHFLPAMGVHRFIGPFHHPAKPRPELTSQLGGWFPTKGCNAGDLSPGADLGAWPACDRAALARTSARDYIPGHVREGHPEQRTTAVLHRRRPERARQPCAQLSSALECRAQPRTAGHPAEP